MWKRIIKRIWRVILRLSLFGLLALFVPRLVTSVYAASKIFSVETVSADRVAIVFGAEVKKDGTPSAVLRDRVKTARRAAAGQKKLKLAGVSNR